MAATRSAAAADRSTTVEMEAESGIDLENTSITAGMRQDVIFRLEQEAETCLEARCVVER